MIRKTQIDRRNVVFGPRASIEPFLCFGIFGGVIPALAIATTEGRVSVAMLVAAGITAYAGFRLSYLSFRSAQSFLQLTFWMFVYCWLGLAATVQLRAGRFPWPATADADQCLYTEALIIAGIAAYEIGTRRKLVVSPSRVPWFTLRRPSLNRQVLLSLACVGISCWSISRQGGTSEIFRTRYELQRMARSSTKAQSERLTNGALQRVPPIIALLLSIYLYLKEPNGRGERRRARIIFITLLLYNLVANYPPALPRLSLGFIFVSVTTIILCDRPKLVPVFVMGSVFALTVVFPYTDYFRSQTGYSVSDLSAPTRKLIDKADYDAFQMIGNTIQVVNERGVSFGYNLLGSVLFFVPRGIWPEKPYGTGRTVGEIVGYSGLNLNLSSPLWAEFYYAGGAPLVILGFWIYGVITKRVEQLRFTSPCSVVVIAYAAGVQIFLLRGDLMNAVAFFSPGLILLFMFIVRPSPLRSRAENRSPFRDRHNPALPVQSGQA